MNLNQLSNMILRLFVRKAVNKGINVGINQVTKSRSGPPRARTPQHGASKPAPDTDTSERDRIRAKRRARRAARENRANTDG